MRIRWSAGIIVFGLVGCGQMLGPLPKSTEIALITAMGAPCNVVTPSYAPSSPYNNLILCPYKATGVTILDTTIDPSGKEAQVVYKWTYEPTPQALEIKNAGRLTDYDITPLPSYLARQTVTLKKLDATGWQVKPSQ